MEQKKQRNIRNAIASICVFSFCAIIIYIYFNHRKSLHIDCEQTQEPKSAKIELQTEKMADMKFLNFFCDNNKLATIHLKDSIPLGIEVVSKNNLIIAFSDINNDNIFDVVFVFDSNYNVIEYFNINDPTAIERKKDNIDIINEISNKIDTVIKKVKEKQ